MLVHLFIKMKIYHFKFTVTYLFLLSVRILHIYISLSPPHLVLFFFFHFSVSQLLGYFLFCFTFFYSQSLFLSVTSSDRQPVFFQPHPSISGVAEKWLPGKVGAIFPSCNNTFVLSPDIVYLILQREQGALWAVLHFASLPPTSQESCLRWLSQTLTAVENLNLPFIVFFLSQNKFPFSHNGSYKCLTRSVLHRSLPSDGLLGL